MAYLERRLRQPLSGICGPGHGPQLEEGQRGTQDLHQCVQEPRERRLEGVRALGGAARHARPHMNGGGWAGCRVRARGRLCVDFVVGVNVDI